jgi:hypothetical protein
MIKRIDRIGGGETTQATLRGWQINLTREGTTRLFNSFVRLQMPSSPTGTLFPTIDSQLFFYTTYKVSRHTQTSTTTRWDEKPT